MAVNNMNKVTSLKYGFPPDFVKEKALNDKKFHEIYNFHRLVKVQKHAERYERSNIRSDKVCLKLAKKFSLLLKD